MTEHEVRDVVSSMTGSLDEVRREQGWRAIERAIAKPAPVASTRWPWLAVPALAIAIVAVILWPRSKSPDATPPTTLSAKAGERAVFARDGLTLTLIGPGAATIQPGVTIRVDVTAGTVLGERTSDEAPPVELAAAGNTTTTRDAQFAIRVVEGTVVLGTGQRALAMIERETHELATPPAPNTPPAPRTPPVLITPSAPSTPEPKRPSAPLDPPAPRSVSADPPVEPPAQLPPVIEIPLAAKELYARAEAALRVRDPGSAKQLLRRLLLEHPTDPLIDAARYDLALIAISERDTEVARGWLQQVIDTAKEPALRLAATKLAATLVK